MLSIAADDDRRELVATCEHHGRCYDFALLDIDISTDPATSRILAA